MINFTEIDEWFAKQSRPVDPTEIEDYLQHLVLCTGGVEYLDGLAQIYIIYVLSADGYTPGQIGVLTGNVKAVEEALKEICGISQRGVEAKFGFFRLMLVSSAEDAEEMVEAIRNKFRLH